MLQWGHVQKDMERDPVKGLLNLVFGASMGPRPEGHGEFERWNPPLHKYARFNGATSRRTWRVTMMLGSLGTLYLLQWGHVQKDMERRKKNDKIHLSRVASMGPRPEGHGES